MNVQHIQFSPEDAAAALREYKQHRGSYDKSDWEIERIYRAIAKGKTVISAAQAIISAGLDDKNRPLLALCRADESRVACAVGAHEIQFSSAWQSRARWDFKVRTETGANWATYQALTPRIPPQYRPPTPQLRDYW